MDNKMAVFNNREFGSIRVIEENGNYLFCGFDVAKALGYAKPRNAINTHCKGALKRGALTEGGVQELTFIPEGDVYRLIVHSRLPGAERFEKWVFDEVLPMIRKTGGYMTASLLEQAAENRKYCWLLPTSFLPSMRKTGSSPARWNGCGRKQIFMTPLSMKKTAPISEPRRKNCKSGSVRFAVS